MFLVKKRPAASSSSVASGLFPALSFKDCRGAISEEWFVSPSTMALRALGPRLPLPDGFSDTVALRGI